MKVLITDPVDDICISIIKTSGLEYQYIPESGIKEKLDAIQDAHGLIVRSGTIVDERMLDSASNLKVIGRAGVGVDNIDIINATRKGVVVMNTPDVNTISAAEHAIALILTISRNPHIGHYDIINGIWSRNNLIGTELQNKIIGIIGLGKIGREVMERCLSFKMKIMGYDPFINKELFSQSDIEITDLDNVVQKADYLTLHIPLNDKTRNLFDFNRLKMMKKSAKIINVARGGIINEHDLSKALNQGLISGAAIDVFEKEPLIKSNPLLSAKNIVLTPHLGASTIEAKKGVSRAISEQIRDYLLDSKLANAINMPISNMSLLNDIKPFLKLGELLGDIISQLNDDSIIKIVIECQGSAEELRPISLAVLKGILSPNLPDRVNYINAETIAKELGLDVQSIYTLGKTNYNNIISLTVITVSNSYRIDGSIFDDNRPRLVNILGRDMEVNPKGNMLLIENMDVPGVIGQVGTFLGNRKINIAAYLLNRASQDGMAFSVIRIDNEIEENDLQSLRELDGINWAEKIMVNI